MLLGLVYDVFVMKINVFECWARKCFTVGGFFQVEEILVTLTVIRI